jgi:shikimate kinase
MANTKKTVFICGFMGCGKSTVGKLLASKLGCKFTDMDEYIVNKLDMSIPQIFAEKGEDYFRKEETEAVRELASSSGVIACGGGAMLKKVNADIANEAGIVVYIDIDFESCYERIAEDKNRPIVQNNTKEELELIYDGRAGIYKENSSLTVDGSGSPEEIAERILSFIKIMN